MAFKVPNEYRITKHPVLGTTNEAGTNGAFKIPIYAEVFAFVIATNGGGWEHVSVHVIEYKIEQTPTWEEMCKIKDLFWDKDDCVIQYHPSEKDYVNCHPHTLHLWRPINQVIPTPPKIFV